MLSVKEFNIVDEYSGYGGLKRLLILNKIKSLLF